MPKVSRDSATQGGEYGPVARSVRPSSRATHVNFTSIREDFDATPLMKGQPDDRCQCPHWGYVIKGGATFRYADRDEVYEAGDAFYTPPGHIPVKHEPGTEVVIVQPRRGAAHDRGGHDEEPAGDAGRLNGSGRDARGELLPVER